jgi:hypothetical protein
MFETFAADPVFAEVHALRSRAPRAGAGRAASLALAWALFASLCASLLAFWGLLAASLFFKAAAGPWHFAGILAGAAIGSFLLFCSVFCLLGIGTGRATANAASRPSFWRLFFADAQLLAWCVLGAHLAVPLMLLAISAMAFDSVAMLASTRDETDMERRPLLRLLDRALTPVVDFFEPRTLTALTLRELSRARFASPRAAWALACRRIRRRQPDLALAIWHASRFDPFWLCPSPHGNPPVALPYALSQVAWRPLGAARSGDPGRPSGQEIEAMIAVLRSDCERRLIARSLSRPPVADSAASDLSKSAGAPSSALPVLAAGACVLAPSSRGARRL